MNDDFEYVFHDSDDLSDDSKEKISNDNVKKVTDVIANGLILYDKRKIAEKNVKIKPLFKKKSGKESKTKQTKFSIYKYYCYHDSDSDNEDIKRTCDRKCNHGKQVILNRDILTHSEHLSYLAKPKHKFDRKSIKIQCPKRKCFYVKKYPLQATSRIEKLALPTNKYVISTWIQYSKVFSPRHITNMANLLIASKHKNIQTAVNNILEDKKLNNIRKMQCLKETAKIKKKIRILKGNHVKDIMCSVAEVLRNHLMDENNCKIDSLHPDMQALTRIILLRLTQMLCIKNPPLNATNFMDKFLVHIAKNTAIIMNNFLRNSGLQSFYDGDWILQNRIQKRREKHEVREEEEETQSVCCICDSMSDICGDIICEYSEESTDESEITEELELENESLNEDDADEIKQRLTETEEEKAEGEPPTQGEPPTEGEPAEEQPAEEPPGEEPPVE